MAERDLHIGPAGPTNSSGPANLAETACRAGPAGPTITSGSAENSTDSAGSTITAGSARQCRRPTSAAIAAPTEQTRGPTHSTVGTRGSGTAIAPVTPQPSPVAAVLPGTRGTISPVAYQRTAGQRLAGTIDDIQCCLL